VFSALQHGFLQPIVGDGLMNSADELVVTFDRFTRSSPYPGCLRWCLSTLEDAYGCPVDIEFACADGALYLLQCRPQPQRREEQQVRVPDDVDPSRIVFSAHRDISTGAVRDIEYVVLIDPRDYNNLATDKQRLAVGVVVRKLNQLLADRQFILMGPGRWGSRDLRLGIRVGYSDINNTRMLLEVARLQGGYTPEVSFGSHFFQDLVESRIRYLALYPEEEGVVFNEEFLHGSPNALPSLLPEASDYADLVRVIDVTAAGGGLLLNVDMDGESGKALGYLAERG